MREETPNPTDDAVEQLHRAGWSIGSAAFTSGAGGGLTCLVSGSNGENLIHAEGATEAAAWAAALDQARGLGMLGTFAPGKASAG